MDTDHTIAYIGLGSNLGDRAGNLLMAVRGLMEASFHVNKLSGIYETEPVEIESDTKFLNMVAEIHVKNVTPSQMLARLLRIEYLLGRTDKGLKKPRTADLDILFFGDKQVDTEFLTLPHPRLHLRRFVLKRSQRLPRISFTPSLHKEVADLLAECQDKSEVKRWKPNGSRHESPELGFELEHSNDRLGPAKTLDLREIYGVSSTRQRRQGLPARDPCGQRKWPKAGLSDCL